jgi:hypothetical protein
MTQAPAVRVAIAAAAVVVAGIWLWHVVRPSSQVETYAAGSKAAQLPVGASQDPGKEAANPAVEPSNPQVPDISKDVAAAFRNAGNYRDFVLGELPAARAGDRDSQYYISAALAYCEETNRFFFRRKDKTLTVDEAIAERTSTGDFALVEGIKRADSRCRDVNRDRDPSWGSTEEWLAKATQAGQPVAQTITALKVYLQTVATGQSSMRKGGSEKPNSETYNLSEARALISAAIASKNPEVVFQLGDLVGLMNPDRPGKEAAKEALAWRYAACLRGLDCSAGSEWHKQMCLSDPECISAESGVDYLRRLALRIEMTDLELRAIDINDKLNKDDLAGLGLGG